MGGGRRELKEPAISRGGAEPTSVGGPGGFISCEEQVIPGGRRIALILWLLSEILWLFWLLSVILWLLSEILWLLFVIQWLLCVILWLLWLLSVILWLLWLLSVILWLIFHRHWFVLIHYFGSCRGY